MSLWLKIIVSLVLVALFLSGFVSVMSELLSRFSADSFPRMRDSDLGDDGYTEHEALIGGEQKIFR